MEKTFMEEAIRLAEDCIIATNRGPFGAVVVKNGEVIGRGSNQVTNRNDPTAHAEITAIRDACQHLNNFSLAGCEIYSSCEPCPMCLCAIYWARLDRIFYAADRKDAAKIGFDDQYFYEQVNAPLNDRDIPMIQVSQADAIKVFTQWDGKEDKVMY